MENEEKNDAKFYSNAKDYWSEIPATIDGMLGGFAFVSQRDIKGSKLLLKQLFHSVNPPDNKYALDCGAGIGRITKHLLIDLFDKVDLVDQNKNFLDQAEKYIGQQSIHKIGNLYCKGLQDFIPEPGKYDVIWMQWVLGHLTDCDLIKFFKVCMIGLKPNGVIIVKENVTSNNKIEMDGKDSSFTRSIGLLKDIFTKSNLECYRQLKQHDFPNALYSVYMFVLKPRNPMHDVEQESTIIEIKEVIEIEKKENCDAIL